MIGHVDAAVKEMPVARRFGAGAGNFRRHRVVVPNGDSKRTCPRCFQGVDGVAISFVSTFGAIGEWTTVTLSRADGADRNRNWRPAAVRRSSSISDVTELGSFGNWAATRYSQFT